MVGLWNESRFRALGRVAVAVAVRSILEGFARIASSVLFAAIFYIGWMAIFIPAFKTGSSLIRGIAWLSAPVVTAAGFTTGIWIAERLIATRRASFSRIFAWPLVGCAVGAGTVFWFGPMLIVFGMFAAGTASVILKEVIAMTKEGKRG